jgi:hypothetical protein
MVIFLDSLFSVYSVTIHHIYLEPGTISMNKSRFVSNHKGRDDFDELPSWWTTAMGTPHQKMPENTVLNLKDDHASQVFYSYLFRPKYFLRRQLELAVRSFALEQDSCAYMHIRRGDILLHGDDSR